MNSVSSVRYQVSRIKSAGFTLVELVIYMGLLSSFMVVLTNLFVSGIDIKLESEASSSVTQDGRFISLRLLRDIRNANEIILPQNLGDSGSVLELDTDSGVYSYSLVGTDLVFTNGGESGKLNSNGSKVTNLNFVRIGNSSEKATVKINYQLESVTERNSGFEVRDYETTVSLR